MSRPAAPAAAPARPHAHGHGHSHGHGHTHADDGPAQGPAPHAQPPAAGLGTTLLMAGASSRVLGALGLLLLLWSAVAWALGEPA